MDITIQELKISESNNSLYLKNKKILINEEDIICLMITDKDTITKNQTNLEDVNHRDFKGKNLIPYKEFKIFLKDRDYICFNIYTNYELEQSLKKFKKITQNLKPLLYDNFLEESPLIFNSNNYCYVKKEYIQRANIRNGHKDLGNEYYQESEIQYLNTPQEMEGCINFKILELDLGIRKIKLNMYLQKTLEHNEINAPGLISIKQKIKKML